MDARLRRSADAEARWRNDFRTWIESDFDCVLVAEAEGGLVGLVTAHPYWPAPVYAERLDAYVTELYVQPGHRGRGIGQQLVEGLRAWARRIGAAQVRAGVLAANADARRFWKQVGARDFFITVTFPVDEQE